MLRKTLEAFTLLESLISLLIISFLVITLSGSVQGIFQDVEEKLFFLSFENLYCDSQQLAVAQKSDLQLTLTSQEISNGITKLSLPQSVSLLEEKTIVFDVKGGNHSLTKINFATADKTITYQLYLGSGKYQKTTR
ncbi:MULTISPECIES: competence type IV pilus minor pilin ComGD [Streptococcus]|uniref:Competence type IV pilus minor pilin ComGD n=1 Tax=Streptococcus caledonicus TaxID=2614158 RepID=A0ABW0UBN0_9STRE|nr:competence type IV pilus minor pilin ComGD [Streptococcus sp. S784/96/1]